MLRKAPRINLRLRSSVVERGSCKPEVASSILAGGLHSSFCIILVNYKYSLLNLLFSIMEDIAKKYAELKNRFKLPDFEEMDHEFEISVIEHPQFLLREMVHKILDVWETPLHLLEGLLQPDTNSMNNLHEYRALDEKGKGEAYLLYRKLMVLQREAQALLVELDSKKLASFVSKALPEWKSIKTGLLIIIQKMADSWKNDSSVREDLGYLG